MTRKQWIDAGHSIPTERSSSVYPEVTEAMVQAGLGVLLIEYAGNITLDTDVRGFVIRIYEEMQKQSCA